MSTTRPTFGIAALCVLMIPSSLASQWLKHPTPGIPRLPNGAANLSAPTPRMADGSPDLSGIWSSACPASSGCASASLFLDLAKDLQPSDAVMTPWASAIATQRESRGGVDDPTGYCLPAGVPRMYFILPFRIVQTRDLTAFLHETSMGFVFRQVFTDGRPLPTVTEPTWLGYSIGRWDGDTFVVESTGFRDRGYLDTRKGRPHSDALHLTERFRRTDFGHLELAVTIDDAKAFRKPWTVTSSFRLLPDTDLLEAFCENQDKTMEHRRIEPAPPEPPSPPVRE